MEETRIAETAMEAVVNATDNNLKVVLITAGATLAVTAGGYFAVKKVKQAMTMRKLNKKVKVVHTTPADTVEVE